MSTTKIYANTTDTDINVVGIGVVAAHDRVSVTTEYQPPVVLTNYPGLVDVLAEEEAGRVVNLGVDKTSTTPVAPSNNAPEGTV